MQLAGRRQKMENSLLNLFKYALTLIGSRFSRQKLFQFEAVINYLKLGQWMYEHNFRPNHRVRKREDVWAAVARQVGNRRVLYLEFGVYRGESMRYWSRALRHPEAQLHGFDSFEGLPEDWGRYYKGKFDVGGKVPDIDDPRVRFYKGWFERVLPDYIVPAHDRLVINMDADLYSSTIYVLRFMRPFIKPGSFIFFDNMSQTEHEPRAFDDFMRESGLKFRLFCAHQSLCHLFFECIE